MKSDTGKRRVVAGICLKSIGSFLMSLVHDKQVAWDAFRRGLQRPVNHERLRPAASVQPRARFYPVGGEEQTRSRSLSRYKHHQAALSPGWQKDMPVSPES